MSLQDMNVVIEFSLDQPSISLSLLEQSIAVEDKQYKLINDKNCG
jgi:hypothetical protein